MSRLLKNLANVSQSATGQTRPWNVQALCPVNALSHWRPHAHGIGQIPERQRGQLVPDQRHRARRRGWSDRSVGAAASRALRGPFQGSGFLPSIQMTHMSNLFAAPQNLTKLWKSLHTVRNCARQILWGWSSLVFNIITNEVKCSCCCCCCC